MDRFIGMKNMQNEIENLHLKSNMDRFIVKLKNAIIFVESI